MQKQGEIKNYKKDFEKISNIENPIAGVVTLQTSKDDSDSICLFTGGNYKYQIPKIIDAGDV